MLIVIAPPDTSPAPLALLKQHLHLEHDEQDLVLEAYRMAAIAFVEQETGLLLARQTLEYRPALSWTLSQDLLIGGAVTGWPLCLDIPAKPVRDVRAVSYLDADAAEQVLEAGDYTWEATSTGATVRFARGFARPALAPGVGDAIRVLFDAGYDAPEGGTGTGDDPALALPDMATPAVMILAAHWFEHRAPVVVGQTVESLPLGVQALIDKLRVYR